VETPDLPGAGALHEVRSPPTVPALRAAVRAGAGPRWLLGLSLGGMIAHEWARAHPGEIAGAVLMIFGKVTLGIAAGVVFFRWFGAEHRADRGIESPLGVRRN